MEGRARKRKIAVPNEMKDVSTDHLLTLGRVGGGDEQFWDRRVVD